MTAHTKQSYKYPLQDCKQATFDGAANARRLLEDATFNFLNGRHHSAALLAAFALDEIGKAFLLAKLVLEAVKRGESHLTTNEFNEVGLFRNHHKRLETALQVAVPYVTATPPSALTNQLATDLKNKTWLLRNAVAYLDIDGEAFVTPVNVNRQDCASLLDIIARIQTFIEDCVEPYWRANFHAGQSE